MLPMLLACSSGKQPETGGQGPDGKGSAGIPASASSSTAGEAQYSVEIKPEDATRRSTLALITKGFNLAEAKIEWLVDGVTVRGTNPYTYNAAAIKKGSVVQAKVTTKEKEMRSNEVAIKNSPPEITGGHFVLAGNNIAVDVTTSDADEDSITLTYEWTVNDKPAGAGKGLETRVKRGDKIAVRIIPSDGESEGRPVVLTSEARNMPPAITEQKDVRFDGKVWTCQLKAVDQDGDAFTFILKSGPPGMTIDPNTGLMTWQVPEDFKGKSSCIAAVKDGHGGEVNYTVDIEIGGMKK